MKLTDEQEAIVRTESDFLCVRAFAGTGKTSTLKAFAEARPRARFLYLAFNKAIQLEASAKFPKNVKCQTSHSLAYGTFGRPYRSKLQPNLRPIDVLIALGVEGRSGVHFGYARAVTKLLLRWLASDKPRILDCVSLEALPPDEARKRRRHISSAEDLWEIMKNPEDRRIPMLHDGYLKLYQLSTPALTVDYILFDEAQDANPVTADIVRRQQCQKVFVGDSHQQIYSFRGAVDALDQSGFTATRYLTGSFRFGSDIAEYGNSLLRLKNEQKELRGLGPCSPNDYSALIARGNAAIFEEAAGRAEQGNRIHFPGGFDGYRFDLLLDMHWLKAGERGRIRDSFIRSFDSIAALEDYAETGDERDLKAWSRVLAKSWRRSIPEIISLIRESAVEQTQDADITITTAHKAKGLEFHSVLLAEDYPGFTVSRNEPDIVNADPEEINLLYVAATRAQEYLSPNDVLSNLVSHIRHRPNARLAGSLVSTHSEDSRGSGQRSDGRPAESTTPSVLRWLREWLDRDERSELEKADTARPRDGGAAGPNRLGTQINHNQASAVRCDSGVNASGPTSGDRSLPGARYTAWTADEDARLRIEWKNGTSIAVLAARHGRSKGAISSRLRHLGLRR